MNKHLSLLTAALFLIGASSAVAASSTDLTVKGKITPTACTPSLADGGFVDYGKIPAKDLNPTAHTKLDDKSIQLTVNCDASAQFAINVLDNRENTASEHGDWSFGLGLINGSEKLGRYNLGFINPVADVPVRVVSSPNEGTSWFTLDDDLINRGDWVAFGTQSSGKWAPEFVKNVTVNIALQTHIAPSDTLTLTNEVLLDGSATVQILYP